jgi:AAA domain
MSEHRKPVTVLRAENDRLLGTIEGAHAVKVVSLDTFADTAEEGRQALLGDAENAVIPEDGDVMFYGDGGAGKTTLVIDLACHLAAGDLGSESTSRSRGAYSSSRTRGRGRSSARSSAASGTRGPDPRSTIASRCSRTRGARSRSPKSTGGRSSPTTSEPTRSM